jgi:hypothetical protein
MSKQVLKKNTQVQPDVSSRRKFLTGAAAATTGAAIAGFPMIARNTRMRRMNVDGFALRIPRYDGVMFVIDSMNATAR